MSTDQTLRSVLGDVRVRWTGESDARVAAARALVVARGAVLEETTGDESPHVFVHVLSGAPFSGLTDGLDEILGVQAMLAQAAKAGTSAAGTSTASTSTASTSTASTSTASTSTAGAKVLLVSSLEVLGARTGSLFESHPSRPPFPHAKTRGAAHWDVDEELRSARAEAASISERARHGDLAASVTQAARGRLRAAKEPSRGQALDDEVERELLTIERDAHHAAGLARAKAWGFVSTRGWAHAIAEQLVAASELSFTVLRTGAFGAARADGVERVPASIIDGEGVHSHALAAWVRAAEAGPVSSPSTGAARLELLPVDVVAGGLLVALAHLLSGDAPSTFHAVADAQNALTVARAADLVDLAARRERRGEARSLRARAQDVLRSARRAVAPPAAPLEGDLVIFDDDQRLRGGNLATSQRRVLRDEPLLFAPQEIDWRRWLLDRHLPAARQLSAKSEAAVELRPYDDLVSLLEEGAERFASRPALSMFLGDVRTDVSYRELLARARAVAQRLGDQGVGVDDRVYLSGENCPEWVICFFGVVLSGAACVPLDPALDAEQVRVIHNKAAGVRWITDDSAAGVREVLGDGWELQLAAAPGPKNAPPIDTRAPSPDQIASVLFTSGTTGEPKGVMLSHRNFTSLIASLARVFDMHGDDRLLSVLPLHHTFEFSCGLLLPLVAGAQIHYLDELTGERLIYGLREGRVTGMVGVPALWQLLERRLRKRIDEQPAPLRAAFDVGLSLNRALANRTGRDVGKLLFKQIHDELGGHLRTVISGGAALPSDVHELFHGLGLPIAEGYGLTEAAPVLTVAEPTAGVAHGSVGRAVPGVELRIDAPDAHGVGEVLARGPNVMKGYFDNEAATQLALDDGWLRTGDLGRLDEAGNLTIVGRAKDVVVTSAGENIYLDDVEARLGEVAGVAELTLVGVPDARGGERLALVYTRDTAPTSDGATKPANTTPADTALVDAIARLPPVFRPQLVRVFDADELPRTATRKVKRKDVASWLVNALERQTAERGSDEDDAAPSAPVRAAIATAAGVEVRSLSSSTDLYADLSFDSLMWVELQGGLAPSAGGLDAEELARCRTVAEVEAYVQRVAAEPASTRTRAKDRRDEDEEQKLALPDFVWRPARAALATAQRELYRALYTTQVEGRAHIPQNRSCIVVANHTSHLDTGLVKYALGPYGKKLKPLAARDYFFAGNKLKVAFFENLTNLEPIDRETGSGRAFEQAVDVVERGHVVLIFPEGTRRPDGTLGDFKPLVGRLSLTTGVDVLPMHLSGAWDALPKGAAVPKTGALRVRIGPPLQAGQLRRLTGDLPAVTAARAATSLIRQAVVALADERALELSRIEAVDDKGRPLSREGDEFRTA